MCWQCSPVLPHLPHESDMLAQSVSGDLLGVSCFGSIFGFLSQVQDPLHGSSKTRCPLSYVILGNIVSAKKGKNPHKTCWKEILLTVRLQKKSKAMCTDVYVPLICNGVYYISFLGLEHQVGELTYVFIHWFVHNHNQQNDKEIHRIT